MDHRPHLPGAVVSLLPLRVDRARDLAALGDAAAYAWNTSPMPLSQATARSSIEDLLDNPGVMPFAVTDTGDGTLRGITSCYEHVEWVPRVEIGHTYYGRRFWAVPRTRTPSS